MTAEEWRPARGFPGYIVSSEGRVISLKRTQARELSQSSGGNSGYLKVSLSRDGSEFSRSVHTLVAEAFHGARPEGMQVRHLDGDKFRNAASNLAWGSATENAADKARHGTEHNARKTHCPEGHPLAGNNVYLRRGRRYCRICKADWLRAYKQRQAFRAAGIPA